MVCRKEFDLERIWIWFLGDSGVGKTSFIQRFCTDNFKETFAATIGVDLQVKMLNIDDRIVALQLWDTVRKQNEIWFYDLILFLGWSRKVCFNFREENMSEQFLE